MKIELLNDTHFGARGDSQLFFDYFMKFFDEVFFPYLKENNIDTVIHAVVLYPTHRTTALMVYHIQSYRY